MILLGCKIIPVLERLLMLLYKVRKLDQQFLVTLFGQMQAIFYVVDGVQRHGGMEQMTAVGEECRAAGVVLQQSIDSIYSGVDHAVIQSIRTPNVQQLAEIDRWGTGGSTVPSDKPDDMEDPLYNLVGRSSIGLGFVASRSTHGIVNANQNYKGRCMGQIGAIANLQSAQQMFHSIAADGKVEEMLVGRFDESLSAQTLQHGIAQECDLWNCGEPFQDFHVSE